MCSWCGTAHSPQTGIPAHNTPPQVQPIVRERLPHVLQEHPPVTTNSDSGGSPGAVLCGVVHVHQATRAGQLDRRALWPGTLAPGRDCLRLEQVRWVAGGVGVAQGQRHGQQGSLMGPKPGWRNKNILRACNALGMLCMDHAQGCLARQDCAGWQGRSELSLACRP